MRRMFDDNLYQFDSPQPSYWEATAGSPQFAAAPLQNDEQADAARQFYGAQVEAVELVRQLAREEGIEYQAYGNAEIEVAHTPRAFVRLQREHDVLRNTLGLQAEIVPSEECRERFYDSTEQYGALVMRPAFGLHPLRYCLGLARLEPRGDRLSLARADLHDRIVASIDRPS